MLDSYPKKIELTLLADYLSVLGKNTFMVQNTKIIKG